MCCQMFFCAITITISFPIVHFLLIGEHYGFLVSESVTAITSCSFAWTVSVRDADLNVCMATFWIASAKEPGQALARSSQFN